ncbi:MAG: DUF2092 domain-containing protein [Candidatus Omnitrophota bacterium]
MLVRIFIIGALLAVFLVTAADNAPAQQQAQGGSPALAEVSPPVVHQRALSVLKRMSDTLSQAKTIRFSARSIVPVRTPSGMWASLYGTSRVVKEGASKLFAQTRGDFFPYDFYFNGTTITAYSPTKNLYAERNEPGTVNNLIENAYKEEGRSFPYADILVAEPYSVLTEGLINAVYVGQSVIDGVKTDHLAFSNKGVQWQIWVGVQDHLPRLVDATYLDDASEPSYTVEFSDWKLNEPVEAGQFIFKNKSKAVKVEFRKPAAFWPRQS